MPLSSPGIPLSELGAPNGVARLDGTGKVPAAELPVNSRQFKGAWNAATNTPALANGTGTAGDEYVVTVAGSHDFGGGAIAFVVGDAVVYNGTVWEKVPAEFPVATVNGKVGVVVLVAADVGALALAGGALTGATTVVTGADGNKLWLAKYTSGTGHNNAPTAIGAAATYLYVGGREYGNNGWGGIGFSYVSDATQHPAVWIGWEEKNTAGNTNGDFVVATRPTTTNVAPTERLRITAAGDIAAATGYAPANPLSLATKGYVDAAAGGVSVASHSNTSGVTLGAADPQVQLIDASGSSGAECMVELPDTPTAGRVFTIKKTDSSSKSLIINTGVTGSIDGQASIGIASQYGFRTIVGDGSNWWIIASGGS